MGFLARAVADRKSASLDSVWSMILGGYASKAGPSVTLNNALKVSTAFACMKVLSQGCAQVPFKLLQEKRAGELTRIEPARDHALYDLVTVAPNDWTTSFEFRETLVLHAAMGNAYAFKNKLRGRIGELILLNPARVQKMQRADWSITYKVTGADGGVMEFPSEAIWHVPGPSWDGVLGLDVLQLAREALGVSIALEESVASLHANGVRPSGTYSVDGNLDDAQHKKLTEWLKRQAAAGAGTPLVLDRGAKWLTQAMTSVDAQTREMRQQQIEEVCRFFGVSPFMVFNTDKAPTYASAEQFQIQHVVHTLSPWFTRIEGSADAYLLSKDERKQGFYFKFTAAGLLRGAMKDQGEFFARALGAGGTRPFMTQDEIRAMLDLNPMGGDAGKLLAPLGTPAPVDPVAKEAQEAVKALTLKFSALQERPAQPPVINVTVNQEPVTVKHEGGAINVNTPEVKAAPITVNVPAAAAPVVNVQTDVHVPQGPAPIVNNEVNVQKQDAPHVTLEAVLPPLTVVAQLPARKTHSETTVKRDANGNINGSVTNGTEKDA